MRQLLQIFFGLLIPLVAIFTVISIGYYSFEYNLDKSIKLALLSGVIIGFGISFVASISIFIMRLGTQPRVATYKEQKMKAKQKKHENVTVIQEEETESEFTVNNFMLLMDKTIAYQVNLDIIRNQDIRKEGYHHNFESGVISIKNIHEFIKINISSLTKHTVKVSMEYKTNSSLGKNIIMLLREKESSLLKYK